MSKNNSKANDHILVQCKIGGGASDQYTLQKLHCQNTGQGKGNREGKLEKDRERETERDRGRALMESP